MTYWTWDNSLSVGIDIIDKQHHRIVDYINELDEAKRAQDKEKIDRILMGVVDYTRTHLSFEEELMQKAGYPLSPAHKKVHEGFVNHINKCMEKHEKGEDVSSRVMSDLQIWLTNHIMIDDHDYIPYVSKYTKKRSNEGWLSSTLKSFFG